MERAKKTWQRPKLIILARGRPEEHVLAGCKIVGTTVEASNKIGGCSKGKTCLVCNIITAS